MTYREEKVCKLTVQKEHREGSKKEDSEVEEETKKHHLHGNSREQPMKEERSVMSTATG